MNEAAESIKTALTVPGAFSISILGFCIVFVVLIVLMFVIKAMRGFLEQTPAAAPAAAVPAPASVAPAAAAAPVAPVAMATPAAAVAAGYAVAPQVAQGELRLYGVDDQTAAILMATVAYELQAPVSELRFLSISAK